MCLSFNHGAQAKKKDELQVIVTTTFINVHTGPGRGFPVFHVLEKGETITLIKSKTDWVKISTAKEIIGWVNRRSLDDTVGINGELVKLGIPDREDYSQRRWEVGFSLGEFEDVESLGVHGAYRFTNNLSAELRFNQASGSRSNSKLISWGLVHQPFPEWKISPFFTIANGEVTIEPNSNVSTIQDLDDDFFLVGIGAYYYYSHRFMIRFEYNNYTTLPDRDSNEDVDEWKLGLSAFF
ncbi:MAG: SH3 domain-containing protein [Cellvibrionaceae bacterium]